MSEIKEFDCQRGCEKQLDSEGNLNCTYRPGCCKLSVFDWLEGISDSDMQLLFQVRFKNTRKGIYINDSNQTIRIGDKVIVEATNGYDLGIVTLSGAMVARVLERSGIDGKNYTFKKIYRKARQADIEKWREATAREHSIMIRSRQIAAALGLDMKIGDVEVQGDGTKAIFYYIADERVDFRQLIKDFAEEFRIRIEMKQIGARQEAGLIGGIGVCGQAICCSRHMNSFQSITTSAARCQELSLNPLKLAGQCGKLKCCINHEASVYADALNSLPKVNGPIYLEDGEATLVKRDILKGIFWFSYDPGSMTNMHPVMADDLREILALNRQGKNAPSLVDNGVAEYSPEFLSAAGEESISRFDKKRGSKHHRSGKKESGHHHDNHKHHKGREESQK